MEALNFSFMTLNVKIYYNASTICNIIKIKVYYLYVDFCGNNAYVIKNSKSKYELNEKYLIV